MNRTPTRPGFFRAAAALLMPLMLCADRPAAQEESRAVWSANFEYIVEIDGVISDLGRLFSAAGREAVLIMAPEMRYPVVVRIKEREVLAVDPNSVSAGPEPDQVEVDDAGVHGPAVPFTRNGDGIIFFQSGEKIEVLRRPPILGATSVEAILEHSPAYRKGMEEYVPAPAALEYLRAFRLPVKVEVFFGSWCPHCKVTVPRFLKTASLNTNPGFTCAYTGLPRPPFSGYPAATERGITGVPVFIVYVEGQEAGRFGTILAGSSVEKELVKILEAYE